MLVGGMSITRAGNMEPLFLEDFLDLLHRVVSIRYNLKLHSESPFAGLERFHVGFLFLVKTPAIYLLYGMD